VKRKKKEEKLEIDKRKKRVRFAC